MSQPTTQPGNQYQYTPLPTDNHIRYLVLEPGQATDPLKCHLRTSALASMPPFEAISYVWGAPEKPFLIYCGDRQINITKNLHEALVQARHRTAPKNVWADAICINQADLTERGKQVALMGELYSSADRVLLCLGKDPDYLEEAESVASLLRDTDSLVFTKLREIAIDWDTFPETEANNPLLADERWAAFRALLEQPWFERGWVVQEVWLGADVRVLWGESEFDWLSLVRAYSWMSARASEISSRHALTLLAIHLKQYAIRHPSEAMPTRIEPPIRYFPYIMDDARGLQLSDARDRIYAFLSLAEPGKVPTTLKPDYTKGHLEVFYDFAAEYIVAQQDLGLLILVDHDESTLSEGYPSWVPRWDTRVTLENIPHLYRPLPGRVLAEVDGRALKVSGTIVGTVKFVSADIHWVMSGMSDIARILSSLMETGIPVPYKDVPPIVAFVSILLAGPAPGAKRTSTSQGASISHRAAYILRLLEANIPGTAVPDNRFEKEAAGGDPAVFHSWVRAWGHTRRVIQTEQGYFGLAPGVVKEGDVICAISGATSLFCLRAMGDGTYKLVGPTHIAGEQSTADGGPIRLGAEKTPPWEQERREEFKIR